MFALKNTLMWLACLAALSNGSMVHGQVATEAEEPTRVADVVYVATPHDVVAKMLDFAQISKDDVVYDLGCGDGRIVATAARRHGCRAKGFDINPARVEEARATVEKYQVSDLVAIEQQDVFELDLTPASVITLYLLPEMNVRLVPQLEKLKPGSRVVAQDYGIEGVTPIQSVRMRSREDGAMHTVMLWTIPLQKDE
ncbi:MAG: cyclopropane-fatty-acyl-phospholipid synthase family protein [Pirellulaceae bacterium]